MNSQLDIHRSIRVNRTHPCTRHRHNSLCRDGERGSHPHHTPPPHTTAAEPAAGGLCSANPDQYGADPG
ncbi:hypothetical protein [Actinomadura sp. 7K507]|uniref:hypothetical protein n=1 Tax=Actinomadura sp. 7K507 TaxID=2530365 RepID=UPI001050C6B8|nr:hypothetical protein [Actinomadura sp. 7K507]TDC92708.1 hypothetical protein E1285_11155 [Actinomadura sp. 7K507]